MVARALPVALLAGAASAACPLSVEITSSNTHVVDVAVTNTGSETLSVFKGNTVFSDHATKDLLVTDAGASTITSPPFPRTPANNKSEGNALPFEGVFVNYKRTGLSADAFQKIEAGQTVTVSVNAAKSYKLDSVAQAKVIAIQGFRYAAGDAVPSSFAELQSCADVSSGEVEVVPDQAAAAE